MPGEWIHSLIGRTRDMLYHCKVLRNNNHRWRQRVDLGGDVEAQNHGDAAVSYVRKAASTLPFRHGLKFCCDVQVDDGTGAVVISVCFEAEIRMTLSVKEDNRDNQDSPSPTLRTH